ncbi:MAG: hypothetical protein ABR950_11545 [Candidatus Dormibacteria bacterium]
MAAARYAWATWAVDAGVPFEADELEDEVVELPQPAARTARTADPSTAMDLVFISRLRNPA